MKNLKKYESFEPEEEWEKDVLDIKPGKRYFVKVSSWDSFADSLEINGYNWISGKDPHIKSWERERLVKYVLNPSTQINEK